MKKLLFGALFFTIIIAFNLAHSNACERNPSVCNGGQEHGFYQLMLSKK